MTGPAPTLWPGCRVRPSAEYPQLQPNKPRVLGTLVRIDKYKLGVVRWDGIELPEHVHPDFIEVALTLTPEKK